MKTAETPPTEQTPPTPEQSLLDVKVEGEAPKTEDAALVEPLTLEKIKLPEGVELDPTLSQEFLDLLNKQDLSKEDLAAGLVELQQKASDTAAEKLAESWTALQDEWVKEVKADPEIGGNNLPPILGGIAKMLNEYPRANELRPLLAASGMGNHLEGVRFMKWVADQLNEGSTAVGGPGNGVRDIAKSFYPNQN